jgi:hypothetical protein
MSERDKFLTEAMGECWHECQPRQPHNCVKCPESVPDWGFVSDINPDFSTWTGFGKLAPWVEKKVLPSEVLPLVTESRPFDDTFPSRFANALYQFLKDRQ